MRAVRILIALLGILAAVFGQPWLTFAIMLVLCVLFRSWEAVLLGAIVDFMWLPPGHFPWFIISAVIFLWALEPLRREFLAR